MDTKKIADNDYTFAEAVQYEDIMDAYVQKCFVAGDERGYPIIKPGETIPNTLYKPSSARVGKRRSKTPDKTFSFLRSGGVKAAVEKMRNKNMSPLVIHAKHMPAGMMMSDWNNKADVLRTFLAHYYYEEGITATSDLARPVELYVFHGTYTYKRTINKTKKFFERPIVHGLHFKLTNNRSLVVMTAHLLYSLILTAWCCRSRFAANVTTNFVSFLELYSKHPEWKQFFDDKGEGMAPLDFMIVIEKGLRE